MKWVFPTFNILKFDGATSFQLNVCSYSVFVTIMLSIPVLLEERDSRFNLKKIPLIENRKNGNYRLLKSVKKVKTSLVILIIINTILSRQH